MLPSRTKQGCTALDDFRDLGIGGVDKVADLLADGLLPDGERPNVVVHAGVLAVVHAITFAHQPTPWNGCLEQDCRGPEYRPRLRGVITRIAWL